jgi:hypothetical protein
MIFDGLILMLLGVLAVPGLIIAKRPDAKRIIDKIAPYQGWIGAVIALWGLFRLIQWFQSFSLLSLGVKGIIFFVIYTVFVFVSIALGFMLGIGVIKTFVKNPQAQAKMDETLAKLAPKQGILGLLALADGVLLFVIGLVPSILF